MSRTRWWATQRQRSDAPVISTGRAYGEVLLVFSVFFLSGVAIAAFSVAGNDPLPQPGSWTEAIPASIDQVAVTVLCVLVPLLLVARRGLTRDDVGLAAPRAIGLSQSIRIAAWAILAVIAGGIVTSALASGQFAQGSFSYPDLTVYLLHALQAGPLEEIVVLGFTIATLEQARRPRWEIVVVALVLRASYHIYYGPGVLGIFIWAAMFIWLYLRFRTIVPLIVAHSCWDVLATLVHYWRGVAVVDVAAWLALFLTAFITWLVWRGNRAAATGPLLAPRAAAGWHPDPAGSGGLRWFDGWRWTEAVSPPAPAWPPPAPLPPLPAGPGITASGPDGY